MKRRPGKRCGSIGKLKDLIKHGSNTIVAIGTLAGAVAAIIGVVALLSPHPPDIVEVKFEEAKAESGVLLEQYDDTIGAKETAADGVRVQLAGYRLAADTEPASPAAAGLVAVSEVAKAASVNSSSASTGARQEAALQESERVKTELRQQEAEELKEEEKQKEQATLDEAKVLQEEERQKTEALHGETTQSSAEQQAQAAQKQAEARAAKALGEAKLRATETAAVKKEEEHPGGAPPASSSPLHREGEAKVATGTGVPTREIEEVLRKAGVETSSGCDACALRPTVEKAIADTSSNLQQAARLVVAAFHSTRVGIYEHKPQPVGATVTYTIHFVGYEGKRVSLEWTLCAKGTRRPLPREWWRNVVVKQIKPTSNTTRIAGSFWAPLPPTHGEYYFRLRVFYGEVEIAHEITDPFT
jgi:hypothetical protein